MGRHIRAIYEVLLEFDYVPTGEPLFPEIVGPEIMSASPFKKAFARSVGQAQESGLFNRAEKLQEFKVEYSSYSVGASSAPEVLDLSDLKPFFLIWSAGLGVAVLTLMFEVATAFSCALCVKRKSRKRRKQRLDLSRRSAY
ncbi:unnamed protein product [Ixodes hexagonus]